jgi:hypothetical protein
MWITKTSINQPVFATMVMVALLVLGIFSYNRLPVEEMPNVSNPIVFVSVAYPGASPEQVENDLIKPIENVLNTVNGKYSRPRAKASAFCRRNFASVPTWLPRPRKYATRWRSCAPVFRAKQKTRW